MQAIDLCIKGIAVRLWQLGIEMVPLHTRLWVLPIYATIGGSFGYWLEGVGYRQDRILLERKELLLKKRWRLEAAESSSPDDTIASGI
jgi:hypothetical protein